MEFQIGQTYSGYEFLDVLKRSKNGIEYRVRNTRAGRLEALRSLPESAQGDQERSERFLREMRVHAGLLHPNIVTMFAAMELENHLVMTTELVEGPTLADRLRLGPLSWTDAVTVVRQVLAALVYAHRESVVHRDINPDNIVISAEGVVKVGNFALAKAAASPKLTQIGMMIGNMRYISPEQIKGKGEVDARSDLYAVGMVLYELLCGRPAFVCESQFEVMAAQVSQAPPPPDELNPAVPKELAWIVLKALAKDPAFRYQSAAEFDETLLRVCPASAGVVAHTAPEEAKPVQPEAVVATAPVRTVAPPAPMRTVAPPMPSDVPAFLTASQSLSKQQLTIGVLGGTCLGVALVALWLFAR